MNKNKLVQITTDDGLILHGFYAPSVGKGIAVLYIHGMEGNFYQDKFVYNFADEFEKKDVGFLTINNRGAGKDTDFETIEGIDRRVGSRYELLEEAHFDITAGIKFLINEGYDKLVLIGHSAGTIKTVRYLFEGELKDKIAKLILLSPIDPLGARIAKGRSDIETYLKQAKEKVDQGKGEELITSEFDHDIMSYQNFVSWYKRDNFERMFEFCTKDYNFPILKQIKMSTKIIVGSKDEYLHPSNPDHPEEAMEILLKNIPNSTGKIINGAGHSFELYEDEVTKEVSNFI